MVQSLIRLFASFLNLGISENKRLWETSLELFPTSPHLYHYIPLWLISIRILRNAHDFSPMHAAHDDLQDTSSEAILCRAR
jgi:hypothetical protein